MANKRTRLFYFPVLYGLFSVFCILLFFIWPIVCRPRYHSMEVNWYSDILSKRYGSFYRIPNRQYLDITFTGDTAADRVELQFGQLYIRQMIQEKDTVHGISFHFSKLSRYATFVEVLDICNIEEAPTYCASDDGIKVYIIRKIPSKGTLPAPEVFKM